MQVATRPRAASLGVLARLVEPPKQHRDDHLLLATIDLVELEHGALARPEERSEVEVPTIVEHLGAPHELLDSPLERGGAGAQVEPVVVVLALRGKDLGFLDQIGGGPLAVDRCFLLAPSLKTAVGAAQDEV